MGQIELRIGRHTAGTDLWLLAEAARVGEVSGRDGAVEPMAVRVGD